MEDTLEEVRKARWFLVVLTARVMFQGFSTTGFVNGITTTIKRRFGFSSTQTGLVNSTFDIETLMLMIPVTYYGERKHSHKPKWIGSGLLLV